MNSSAIYDGVQQHYGSIAKASKDSNSQQIAKHFGYAAEDLESIPTDANLGLSCGNPLTIATLKPGETVIDLGCGAGFDVFQVAKKVGSHGKAIGVDQNDDMLAKANKNAAQTKHNNVQFVKSSITNIDLPNACADCIISNCVINLVPEDDKPEVFKEMFRLLKPGGRVAVSDILAKKDMPEHIRNDMALFVGCIAGASRVEQYDAYLREVGFADIAITDTAKSVNVYQELDKAGQSCCGVTKPDKTTQSCCGVTKTSCGDGSINFDDWAASYIISAAKPNQ